MLAHNAPLSEKLAYGGLTACDVDQLIEALRRLEALDLVLENVDLDTDPEGLAKELDVLIPGD